MGTVSVIGGCVCLDGCSVVATVGWSEGVFSVWFKICEISVFGIYGGSTTVVSDGSGT